MMPHKLNETRAQNAFDDVAGNVYEALSDGEPKAAVPAARGRAVQVDPMKPTL